MVKTLPLLHLTAKKGRCVLRPEMFRNGQNFALATFNSQKRSVCFEAGGLQGWSKAFYSINLGRANPI